MIQLIPEFEEGQEVVFKTDPEESIYIVTGYLVHGREIMYECTIGGAGGIQRVYAYVVELLAVEVDE